MIKYISIRYIKLYKSLTNKGKFYIFVPVAPCTIPVLICAQANQESVSVSKDHIITILSITIGSASPLGMEPGQLTSLTIDKDA